MEEPMIEPGISTDCVECESRYGYGDPIEFYEAIVNEDVIDEGSFSRSPCARCNCHLGGDRFIAHLRIGEDKVIHYEICGDCLYLLANGTYPDDFIPCN